MARASGRNDGGGYAGRSGESKAARWGRMMMAVVRMAARIDGGGGGAAVASPAVGRRWRRWRWGRTERASGRINGGGDAGATEDGEDEAASGREQGGEDSARREATDADGWLRAIRNRECVELAE
uniref:DUF834 domain-containing protein n=1 Tax=Oryza barthii TaxID=65489 RepID=A0A0D3F4K9_9ORYZ